jgi:hypothetical protein
MSSSSRPFPHGSDILEALERRGISNVPLFSRNEQCVWPWEGCFPSFFLALMHAVSLSSKFLRLLLVLAKSHSTSRLLGGSLPVPIITVEPFCDDPIALFPTPDGPVASLGHV